VFLKVVIRGIVKTVIKHFRTVKIVILA